MKKMLFVMNPFAGTRKANRQLADILSIFNRDGYDVTAYMTAGQGDATRVVASRAKEFDLIVCCGGDGTFNETVAGLQLSGEKTPIGYIPAGSTNDFANSLGLPAKCLEAAEKIVNGTPQPYDIGIFGNRYFTYVASFGAFTKASYATPQSVKNALGHTAYILSGIQELSQIHPVRVKMELDEETVEGDFLFGAICNSTSVGGILTLDPKQVDMQDGKFEILLVRSPQNVAELAECINAINKQVYNCKMLTFRSTSSVKIYTEENIPWTLDGEMEAGSPEIFVKNLHLAISLMQ